jgi:Raf kinase inhibitor-like YbhB/YbcL family protein
MAMAFELKSSAFAAGQPIPLKYTADGQNLSPPLEWSDPPAGTKGFALIVEDPDAPNGTFRHWGIFNIKAEQRQLPEGMDASERYSGYGTAINDFGEPGYGGPAPPKDHGIHHYHFRLAAVNVESLAPQRPVTAREVWLAAEGHLLGQVELIGTYSR